MGKRDASIDLMRFLGVLSIMIAHANPPDWFFQLRNFGTPLLIITSALTSALIYKRRSLEVIPFLKKRVSRLIFPAWIFLLFFFSTTYFFSFITGYPYPYSASRIFSAFAFYGDIGFLWIFVVYIMLALVTPWALKLNNAITSHRIYFLLIAMGYLLYELILRDTQPYIPEYLAHSFNWIVFTIAPYSLLFLYGLRLGKLSNRQVAGLTLLPLAAFLCTMALLMHQTGHFVPTEIYKYPPTLYYLSYAMIFLNAIFLLCRHHFKGKDAPVIVWISTNSLWIYLWHIYAVVLFNKFDLLSGGFLICMRGSLMLLGFGIAATYLQNRFCNACLAESKLPFLRQLYVWLT